MERERIEPIISTDDYTALAESKRQQLKDILSDEFGIRIDENKTKIGEKDELLEEAIKGFNFYSYKLEAIPLEHDFYSFGKEAHYSEEVISDALEVVRQLHNRLQEQGGGCLREATPEDIHRLKLKGRRELKDEGHTDLLDLNIVGLDIQNGAGVLKELHMTPITQDFIYYLLYKATNLYRFEHGV